MDAIHCYMPIFLLFDFLGRNVYLLVQTNKHTLQILHRNKAVVLEYPAEKKGLINFAT